MFTLHTQLNNKNSLALQQQVLINFEIVSKTIEGYSRPELVKDHCHPVEPEEVYVPNCATEMKVFSK